MECINVIIADNHKIIRECLKQLLELDGDIKVIGETDISIELIDNKNPDILLLDISMPIKNGLLILKKLKDKNCNTKIIVITIHNEVEYLMRALELGVDGYMLKDSEINLLRKAILSVYNGECYIQSELLSMLEERRKYLNNL